MKDMLKKRLDNGFFAEINNDGNIISVAPGEVCYEFGFFVSTGDKVMIKRDVFPFLPKGTKVVVRAINYPYFNGYTNNIIIVFYNDRYFRLKLEDIELIIGSA